ncbi:hypothetical protein FRX31_017581 [Thalictrum thalictroides]|uniref:Uncharacterized protein n=1 Tax=Thalictrum thalictroides TaxID=46969 RepID=A0A7J6W743_THATH|nr:hypothetical protein FRX31_017581 [Thalictrum thalictroides]
MVADESVNNYMVDSETLSSIDKFLGLINIMESITNEQQKAEFFFSNGDELKRIIAELEKVGYNGAAFNKWLEGFESSLLLLRDIDAKLSELGKKRKEVKEAKFEALPTKLTEERLHTNGREMVTDESVNSYIMDETLSSMEKFLGLIDTMESITNKQQKAEFFFDNVDELRKMIAELEKVGYNVGSFKKWFDGLELSLLLLRENDGKLSVLDKERKELEEAEI